MPYFLLYYHRGNRTLALSHSTVFPSTFFIQGTWKRYLQLFWVVWLFLLHKVSLETCPKKAFGTVIKAPFSKSVLSTPSHLPYKPPVAEKGTPTSLFEKLLEESGLGKCLYHNILRTKYTARCSYKRRFKASCGLLSGLKHPTASLAVGNPLHAHSFVQSL